MLRKRKGGETRSQVIHASERVVMVGVEFGREVVEEDIGREPKFTVIQICRRVREVIRHCYGKWRSRVFEEETRLKGDERALCFQNDVTPLTLTALTRRGRVEEHTH